MKENRIISTYSLPTFTRKLRYNICSTIHFLLRRSYTNLGPSDLFIFVPYHHLLAQQRNRYLENSRRARFHFEDGSHIFPPLSYNCEESRILPSRKPHRNWRKEASHVESLEQYPDISSPLYRLCYRYRHPRRRHCLVRCLLSEFTHSTRSGRQKW